MAGRGEGNLGLLPFAEEAALAPAGPHGDGNPHQLGVGEGHLLDDQRTHGEARQDDRRITDPADQRGTVCGMNRDRPWWRVLRYGPPDTPGIEAGVSKPGTEGGELGRKDVAGLIAAGKPDDVRPGAFLQVAERAIRQLDDGGAAAAAVARRRPMFRRFRHVPARLQARPGRPQCGGQRVGPVHERDDRIRQTTNAREASSRRAPNSTPHPARARPCRSGRRCSWRTSE